MSYNTIQYLDKYIVSLTYNFILCDKGSLNRGLVELFNLWLRMFLLSPSKIDFKETLLYFII